MSSVGANSDLIGDSPPVHARVTGLVGVLLLASGSFAGFVASRVLAGDSAVAISASIVASEYTLRLGIVGSLVMMIAWLFYALLLYRLLCPVDRGRAMTMLALVLAAVPLYMLNQVNLLGAVLSAPGQLHEQVKLFLALHRFGNLVAGIFFGLWLIPLGLLVFRSGFLPRFLGVLLVLGSPGYLVLFVQAFLFPGSERTLWTNPFLVITHGAELALLLWLLIRGVDAAQWRRRALEAAAP